MSLVMRAISLAALLPLLAVAADQPAKDPSNARARALMEKSFTAHGQAGMDRLNQDETQAICSRFQAAAPPAEWSAKITAANRALIKYPADDQYLGDWKRGEAIAQEGKGMQYSDDPSKPAGGNCYACHQLAKAEIAYGTIGPSLYNYGKNRGNSPAILKLTWGMLYDMKALMPCTAMPRFGAKEILSEEQLKDVMALLFDADSPVNQ
jgi:L-cysteine S-thiosulfotransferase